MLQKGLLNSVRLVQHFRLDFLHEENFYAFCGLQLDSERGTHCIKIGSKIETRDTTTWNGKKKKREEKAANSLRRQKKDFGSEKSTPKKANSVTKPKRKVGADLWLHFLPNKETSLRWMAMVLPWNWSPLLAGRLKNKKDEATRYKTRYRIKTIWIGVKGRIEKTKEKERLKFHFCIF